MVAAVAAKWGGADIVVNSAAEVSGHVAEDFEHVVLDEFVLSSFEDKFVGILRVCRSAVPLMRANKFGRIINLAYSTAREATIRPTRATPPSSTSPRFPAREPGRDGIITVNAVHPPPSCRTTPAPAWSGWRRGATSAPHEHLQALSARTSLGRLVTAGEIADFVTFLASPRSVAARPGRSSPSPAASARPCTSDPPNDQLTDQPTRRFSVMTSTAQAVGELSEPSVLDALLRPRSVAMIGASRDPMALGGRPLGFMARYGYPGKVYPVNGKGGEVQGVTAYASVLDLPEPVDLALVMVRAGLVAQVLRECAVAGVRVAVILSSGFGEGMGKGEGILESVAPELAASGMRVLGPNCEGLASLPAGAPLTFSPVLDIDASGTRLRPGNIAVLSQSGGMGFAVAQWGTAVGLDFSYIITTGNESSTSTCLELAYHQEDCPDTDIVIMLIEAVRDLADLRAVGERFRQAGKRLVVAKLGTTAPGARGAYAHTRHAAGDVEEYRLFFRACGIVEADDEEELIDVVQAIAKSRKLGARELPPGARIGIATTSGGAGVWLADACAAHGLEVPVLSPPVQETMRAHMPPFGSPVNPVDLTAQLTAGGSVAPALAALAGSGEVDAVTLVTSLSSAWPAWNVTRRRSPVLVRSSGRPGLRLLLHQASTRPASRSSRTWGVPQAHRAPTCIARGLAALVREA